MGDLNLAYEPFFWLSIWLSCGGTQSQHENVLLACSAVVEVVVSLLFTQQEQAVILGGFHHVLVGFGVPAEHQLQVVHFVAGHYIYYKSGEQFAGLLHSNLSAARDYSQVNKIVMRQKYTPLGYTISNLQFEVLHKGKKYLSGPAHHDVKAKQYTSRNEGMRSCVDGFIPLNYTENRKQLIQTFKMFKKVTAPLKGLDIQHKGFPLRRIRTSHSLKTITHKKQKNFNLGDAPDEPAIFTNPKLVLMMRSEVVEKPQRRTHKTTKSFQDKYKTVRSLSAYGSRKAYQN